MPLPIALRNLEAIVRTSSLTWWPPGKLEFRRRPRKGGPSSSGHFVDKIRTAPRGYAGVFDAVKINEKELEQLYTFDLAFFDLATEVGRGLDNVEASTGDEAALPAAIRNITSLARQAVETYNRRAEAVTARALNQANKHSFPDNWGSQNQFKPVPDRSEHPCGKSISNPRLLTTFCLRSARDGRKRGLWPARPISSSNSNGAYARGSIR